MNTAHAKYDSLLYIADNAQFVKIGKTVYAIIEISRATETESAGITIEKGTTQKTLMPGLNGQWTLYSGHVGLPKLVSPEFI